MRVSANFRAAIKLSSMPAYKIAHLAGIHPTTLSKLLCGIEYPKENDHRILSIAKVLGLSPEDCFEEVTQCHN